MRCIVMAVAIASLTLAVGCAGGGGAAPGEESRHSAPPAGSPLAQIELGMNDVDVRKRLGEPDSSTSYATGKAWIPFYYGPDTARTDWMYEGQGRVVFSRNRYSGALKVIRVLHDPSELM